MPGPRPVTHIQQHGRQRQHLLIVRLAFLRTLFDQQPDRAGTGAGWSWLNLSTAASNSGSNASSILPASPLKDSLCRHFIHQSTYHLPWNLSSARGLYSTHRIITRTASTNKTIANPASASKSSAASVTPPPSSAARNASDRVGQWQRARDDL